MESESLRAAIEKSRRFSHDIDGRHFELVLPTQFAIDCISAEVKHFPRIQRKLVTTALRGWNEVRASDLKFEAAGSEPLAYTAETAELLLDERPDWEAALMQAIASRVEARRKALEEQAGN